MKSLIDLSLKMREQRLEILKDNEESLVEQKDSDEEDEEEVNEADEETKDGVMDGAEDDEIFRKVRKAQKKAQEEDESSGDEESDSDYEYTGGDLAIYDSALESVDELLFIKETVERINTADAGYMSRLMAGVAAEELAKFNENMQTAQALKEREEIVRK